MAPLDDKSRKDKSKCEDSHNESQSSHEENVILKEGIPKLKLEGGKSFVYCCQDITETFINLVVLIPG